MCLSSSTYLWKMYTLNLPLVFGLFLHNAWDIDTLLLLMYTHKHGEYPESQSGATHLLPYCRVTPGQRETTASSLAPVGHGRSIAAAAAHTVRAASYGSLVSTRRRGSLESDGGSFRPGGPH